MTKIQKRSRKTMHLTQKEVRDARAAYLLSEMIGRPLNVFMTINLADFSRSDHDRVSMDSIIAANERVTWMLRRWLKANTGAATYVTILERARHGGRGGPHIHALVHMPPDRVRQLVPRLERLFLKALKMSSKEWGKLRKRKGFFKMLASKGWAVAPVKLPFWIETNTPRRKWAALSPKDSQEKLAYMCKTIDQSAPVTFLANGRQTSIGEIAANQIGRDVPLYEEQTDRPFNAVRISGDLSVKAQRAAGVRAEDDFGWMVRSNVLHARKAQTAEALKNLMAAPMATTLFPAVAGHILPLTPASRVHNASTGMSPAHVRTSLIVRRRAGGRSNSVYAESGGSTRRRTAALIATTASHSLRATAVTRARTTLGTLRLIPSERRCSLR